MDSHIVTDLVQCSGITHLVIIPIMINCLLEILRISQERLIVRKEARAADQGDFISLATGCPNAINSSHRKKSSRSSPWF